MAAALTVLSGSLGGKVLTDSAVTNTVVANPTTGGATIFHLEIDNTANSSVTYLKMYEATSVTLGTTQPSIVVKAAAATKEYLSMPAAPSNACSLTFIYN